MTPNLQIFNLIMTLAVGGKQKKPRPMTGAKGLYHVITYNVIAGKLQHR
jgi:hypothetical protein